MKPAKNIERGMAYGGIAPRRRGDRGGIG